jgi:hypothetical protein
MANLILASEFTSKQTGAQMWHVYRSNEGEKSSEFYFYQPLKALRYAFMLRKQGGGFIPKAIYNKLLAAVKAAKPAPAPEAEQGESAPVPERAAESTPAPEEAQPAAVEPSPLARQWEEMKSKHPDAILLFRVDDFYMSFGDDAVAVSEILGIILTRTQAKDVTERQAAFPAHSLDSYLPRLVRAGKRVAICDGLPEPQPKKVARKRSTKKAENK